MRALTWQPVANRRRATVGLESWFFHQLVKVSTCRKLMVKLDSHLRCSPKHRHAARKATLTETAAPEPNAHSQTNQAFHVRDASYEPEENCHLSIHTGTQIVCFCHWLVGKKLFAGLILFTCHFRADARPLRHTEPDNAGPLSRTELPAHSTETFLWRCQSRYC